MKVIYVRDVIDLFDSAVDIYYRGQFIGSNDDVLDGWVNNLVVESIVDEEGIIVIET